jgi:Ca2+-binding EF-hand superfamily protein
MRTVLTLVAGLACWAGTARCSQAQDQPKDRPKAQELNASRLRELILKLDANKDHKLEKSEVADTDREAFERLLAMGDENKNGVLEESELRALMARAQTPGGAQMERLAAMDRNKDGKVSEAEFTGPPELFRRLDANKDGFVTPAEAGAVLNTRAGPGQPPRAPSASVGLVPLTDLGTASYEGKPGGLYPDGRNQRPPAHEEAGLQLARAVRPLDKSGRPDDDGKIVLLSIGMSNTTQEFSTFKLLADRDPSKNPKLVIVDGAQGAMTAAVISNLENPRGQTFWQTIEDRLSKAGVTAAQVQVAWVKQADAGPSARFPEYPLALSSELERIAQILHERFPNLRLAYNSSRIYGGYATTALNPEPYAYQSGFAVKWLIEKQIKGAPELNFDPAKGAVKAPWLAWGPYLWADGTKARTDGLTYVKTDLGPDGTHPGPSGRQKVAKLLLDFFKTDSTARPWFLASNVAR